MSPMKLVATYDRVENRRFSSSQKILLHSAGQITSKCPGTAWDSLKNPALAPVCCFPTAMPPWGCPSRAKHVPYTCCFSGVLTFQLAPLSA